MRKTIALGISALVAAAFCAGTTSGADAPGLKSGLQVGQYAGPFYVQDVTGPNKGTSLCYRCANGTNPVVCVFARETSESLTSLVKSLDSEIAKNPSLKSFVVVLTDDADKTSETLKKFAHQSGVKNIPLTLGATSSGPTEYKIANDADITVMMWKDYIVKVNHAYKKGGLAEADVKAITTELPSILKDK